MRIRTFATLLFATAVLLGCARRDEAEDSAVDTTAAADAAPPPPEVASVRVELSLSAEAKAALQAAGEAALVEVVFGGDPKPEVASQVNELGLLELGKSTQELTDSGTLDFPESLIDTSKLAQIVGQPQVLINVHSTMRSSQRNLIACPFYWETLKIAGEKPVQIACAPLAAE